MTDESPQNQGTAETGSSPQVSIRTIYLKDASYESPNAPTIFQQSEQPQVEVNVGINTQGLGDEHHEVVLTVTIKATIGERTAFLAEVHQGGVFMLRGFDSNNLGPMLGIYCPNVLFPYAREAVANLISKGGFPPVMLDPVNFEALYSDHMKQQRASDEAPAEQ